MTFKHGLMLLALPALAACAGVPEGAAPAKPASPAAQAAAPDAYAGKSVLDAAIQAAGGEAALRNAHELDWSGAATVNAEGKTTELEVQTIIRPFTYARSTSFPKGDTVKNAKTLQVDFGKAWSVSRVTWTPLPAAQEKNEIQQFSLYGVMTLAALKDPGVKVTETAPGKDGTRNLHVEHPKAPPMDLRFDGAAKLVRAAYSVTDPTNEAVMIPEVAEFSGEIASNGVKWPSHIVIKQKDAPFYDLQITKFEVRTVNSIVPIEHTLGSAPAPTKPPPTAAAAAAAAALMPAAVAAAQGPGEETFNTSCNGCHGSGRGGAPEISFLQAKAPAEIVEALTNGKMQRQGSALSAADKANVAMFLTKKPL